MSKTISSLLKLLAGMIFIGIVIAIAIPNFLTRQPTRSPVNRTKNDQRSLATALESYYVENHTYPAWTTGTLSANGAVAPPNFSPIPTFQVNSGNAIPLATLTTPIAHITMLIPDSSAPQKGWTFGYMSQGDHWILWSPGPNRKYELDPIRDYFSTVETQGVPSVALTEVTYDPTNGVNSAGDVWRAKQ